VSSYLSSGAESLKAGEQVIWFCIIQGGFNIDNFEMYPTGTNVASARSAADMAMTPAPTSTAGLTLTASPTVAETPVS